MELNELIIKLKERLNSLDKDVTKTEKGNKAAGIRIRKIMQEIKTLANEVREEVLEIRRIKERDSQ